MKTKQEKDFFFFNHQAVTCNGCSVILSDKSTVGSLAPYFWKAVSVILDC